MLDTFVIMAFDEAGKRLDVASELAEQEMASYPQAVALVHLAECRGLLRSLHAWLIEHQPPDAEEIPL